MLYIAYWGSVRGLLRCYRLRVTYGRSLIQTGLTEQFLCKYNRSRVVITVATIQYRQQ